MIRKLLNPLIFPALLIGVWALWVRTNNFNQIVMPTPETVLQDFVENPGVYAASLVQTLLVSLAGMAIGVGSGWSLACVAWLSRLFSGFLTPMALVLTTIPIVALIPILSRLLGYGLGTTIAIVSILSFLQTYVLVSRGLHRLPAGARDIGVCYGASKLRVLWQLTIPNAVPTLMTAIRTTSGMAMGAALVAEFLMGQQGTGALIRLSKDLFETERAFGLAIGAATVAAMLYVIATFAQKTITARFS